MASDNKPQLIVVAGPNGAGKSTLTSQIYPELIKNTVFINPDEIMLRITRLFPDKTKAQQQIIAAREALKAYDECLREKKSFSLETTLAGHTPLKTMQKARDLNYHITLAYVGIESPRTSVVRVHYRVSLGGHDVPIPDILRRYKRSMENLPRAIGLADDIHIFDNSQTKHRPILFMAQGKLKIYQSKQPAWLKQKLGQIQIGDLFAASEWHKLNKGQGRQFKEHAGLLLRIRTRILDSLHDKAKVERLMVPAVSLINKMLKSDRQRAELQRVAPALLDKLQVQIKSLNLKYGKTQDWDRERGR